MDTLLRQDCEHLHVPVYMAADLQLVATTDTVSDINHHHEDHGDVTPDPATHLLGIDSIWPMGHCLSFAFSSGCDRHGCISLGNERRSILHC